MCNAILIFMSVVISCTGITKTSPNKQIEDLWNNITKDRNKKIRPVMNTSDPVEVYFYFHLTYIQGFDEVKGKFSVHGYFGVHWYDHTISWDPDVYGVESLTFNEEVLWKPTFVLSNPHGNPKRLYEDDSVKRVFHNGKVDWFPSGTFDVTCEADVFRYPFDSQECSISVIVEVYDIKEVEIIPIDFYNFWFVPHRTWDFVGKTFEKIDAPQLVYFRVNLKRKPLFFVFNLILPIVLMCFMNPFVFLLPAESGERIGYSVTVLLAIAVFLTISSSSLPAISEPIIPSICILLFVDVAFSATIVLCVIATLRFYFRREDIPVSKVALGFVKYCRYLRCGCCRRCFKATVLKPQEKDVKNGNEILPTGEYQYRGTDGFNRKFISPTEKLSISWKDVGQELDIVFGTTSGLIMIFMHLLYIMTVMEVIKW